MKFLFGLITTMVIAAVPLFIAVNAVNAQFDPLNDACTNAVDRDDAQAVCDASKPPATNPVTGDGGVIEDVANILALAAAVIAVIVVIIAGITMMTSNGDAGKITNSRNAIIYTVVGLLVIVIARTIVVFVFASVTS